MSQQPPAGSAPAPREQRYPALLLAPLGWLLRALVHAYRWLISPLLAPSCRYFPSCSEYALQALAQHGPLRGGWYALRRICRCHPWGGSGYDPVPPPVHPHGDDA